MPSKLEDELGPKVALGETSNRSTQEDSMGFAKAVVIVALLPSIGCRSEIEGEESGVKALFVQSSIASLSFALDGNSLYLAEGSKVLAWEHEAPTVAGDAINFKGNQIGEVKSGFFCNGKFDNVCDASIYKDRGSVISLKNVNSATKAPAAVAKIQYVTADTSAISNVKIGAPIQGIAKGTCTVNTNAGQKTMSITAAVKTTQRSNGQEIKMIEVSTPVYQYSAQGGPAKAVDMKIVQNVFENGSVQKIAPSTQGANEGSAFMALFK